MAKHLHDTESGGRPPYHLLAELSGEISALVEGAAQHLVLVRARGGPPGTGVV